MAFAIAAIVLCLVGVALWKAAHSKGVQDAADATNAQTDKQVADMKAKADAIRSEDPTDPGRWL